MIVLLKIGLKRVRRIYRKSKKLQINYNEKGEEILIENFVKVEVS